MFLFRRRSKKTPNSASLAFVRGTHRGPVNSQHRWPVTRKMFPFDDVIMVLVCHVFGLQPLPETTLTFLSMRRLGTDCCEIRIKTQTYIFRKCIWKYHMENICKYCFGFMALKHALTTGTSLDRKVAFHNAPRRCHSTYNFEVQLMV